MLEEEEKWYLQNAILEKDLEHTLKALEKCGAKDIRPELILNNKNYFPIYPLQYTVYFKGEINWKKLNQYIGN